MEVFVVVRHVETVMICRTESPFPLLSVIESCGWILTIARLHVVKQYWLCY